MAKRFFYVSLGILSLVAAYQLGVERVSADWDPSLTGDVLGASALAGAGPILWNRGGEALLWVPASSSWDRVEDYDIPVPIADVKILDTAALWCVLVTRDDRVFWIPDHGNWGELPSPTGDPVALPSESAGSVKGRYRNGR